ncbi:hypothetical protein Metvu_1645 [Methanocaldococcus vulcanius M7]|uniref:Uncharacterized protein n=1 Tax=Methanocaldococcus vulcanius (strain ATCC 700851 / DSM 12094 / M7) TaxID=579137 RepID=C9RDW9_METVM|nr:hypothetical protein [Methanocaldococcus vulcanius]ACX73498.1 hypothetical protein Metvu_1645 [Methanocaldococcus vulcanius M7]
MMKNTSFIIILSFLIFILTLISPTNALGSEWISIQPTSKDWIVVNNNNIYLYNGTLKNITPKYILYLNKTYTNDEINKRYGYFYYVDGFCLGNETYVVCNAWDGCHIGKLDINDKILYLYSKSFGQYYNLKSNNKEILACFDNKEGMGAEPIFVELKYNRSSNELIWVGNDFYGLNKRLEMFLIDYLNNYTNYRIDDFFFAPFSFDYDSADKYWLIYVKGVYFISNGNKSEGYKNISGFVKYNGTFHDFKRFELNNSKLYCLYIPFINRISYDKYINQWIVLNGIGNRELLFLNSDLKLVKSIKTDKYIFKVYPINRDEIYLITIKKIVCIGKNGEVEKINVYNDSINKIYKKITYGNYTNIFKILSIQKININNNSISEIKLNNINPIKIGYNGREMLIIGINFSNNCSKVLYRFDGKGVKKIADLSQLTSKKENPSNIQNWNLNLSKSTSIILFIIVIFICYFLYRRYF